MPGQAHSYRLRSAEAGELSRVERLLIAERASAAPTPRFPKLSIERFAAPRGAFLPTSFPSEKMKRGLYVYEA